VTSEVARARTVCAGGLAADAIRRRLQPEHKLVVPAGLDPCVVPADVLKDYLLATDPVSFKPLTEARAAAADPDLQLAQAIDERGAEGSNNWVISPGRTATGRPILANDPHRPVGAPSLRYIAHLDAPGLSIIGAGEPALPGVSLGHNDQTAFGITIFYIDQEDLYVYETRGDAYRYKGGWEPMKLVRETIEVKGEAPREVTLKFTRHGPVVDEDGKGHAFAIRTVWNEPGLSGYFGSSRMWRAKGWDDFQTARNRWGAPPLNLVFADTKGEVGWSAAGRTPVRPNWDGLMPVPGDGRYEWAGFLADGGLPLSRNPAQGFFATANEMNIPAEPEYPRAERKLGFEWSDPTRANRIKAVLAGLPKATLADSMALQTDPFSDQSRRAIALLDGLDTPNPSLRGALGLLRRWDHVARTDSAAASIYEVWVVKHLGRAAAAAGAPEAARPIIGASTPDAVLAWLEGQPPAVRAPILLESLAAAVSELNQKLGPPMESWAWGRLHVAQFTPEAARLAPPELAAQMSLGPLQIPGSASSPRAATYDPQTFHQTAGASVRFVFDVGAWDNSVAINTPGQSADPMSAHYRDLFPLWAAGAYVPLPFSREAVERNAEVLMRLSP
jgi:penicillin amidase